MSIPQPAQLGPLIRRFRLTAGLSQEQLAERSGLSARAVSDLERGLRSHTRPETLRMLADGLDLSDENRDALLGAARPELGHPGMPPVGGEPPGATLPVPLTPLIGRDEAVATVVSLIEQKNSRLVTLTGPGGVGKTRLALEAAQRSASKFPGGAIFVDLSPITDPEMVASTIAQTLGIRESADRSMRDALRAGLSSKHLLLLLDNFEQVIDAAPLITDILTAAPNLQALVTSREVLRLRGEHEIAVQPLGLPSEDSVTNLDRLATIPAVALFIESAVAAKPSFTLTNKTATAVAGICRRLDGLPLAIELAATRVRLFPPALLLEHLDQRLPILTGGQRDRPTRQQTLENTIAWSYDLLPPDEQALFRLIGVFAGGASFDAIETVSRESGAADLDLMSGLTSLVDKSLLRETDDPVDTPRFSMLETVREFAVNAAHRHDDTPSIVQAHASYFLDLALTTSHNFQVIMASFESLDRVHIDIENVRLAIKWFLEHQDGEHAAQFSIAIWGYFYSRGLYREGHEFCHDTLELAQDQGLTARLRGSVLAVHSHMTTLLGDPVRGESIARESLELLQQSDADTAVLPLALVSLLIALREQKRFSEAISVTNQCREVSRQLGNEVVEVHATYHLGRLAYLQDNLNLAAATLEESLEKSRGLNAMALTLFSVQALSSVRMRRGEYADAAKHLRESERLLQQGGFKGVMVGEIATAAASIAAKTSQLLAAVQLLAYSSTNAATFGLIIFQDPHLEEATSGLRQQLGDTAFDTAYRDGQMMTVEEAMSLIHDVLDQAERISTG